MKHEKELHIALDAVKKASNLCSSVQNRLVDIQAVEKQDRSPVTVADLGSQAVIVSMLLDVFPKDSIVGEEEADILRSNADLRRQVVELVNEQIPGTTEQQVLESIDFGARQTDFTQRYWTVDPIDGTKGFLRGEQYAIALALVEKGQVVLGVLGCPNFMIETNDDSGSKGCIFFAVKGQGAFVQPLGSSEKTNVSVDRIVNAAGAVFCESVEKAHASHEDHARISAHLGITAVPYRIDSQAKYAAVACGKASIYLRLPRSKEYREKIWDHAAGCIIISEAGGKVTDFSGKTLDFSAGKKLIKNEGILATNGHLHQKALDAIAHVL